MHLMTIKLVLFSHRIMIECSCVHFMTIKLVVMTSEEAALSYTTLTRGYISLLCV